MLKLLGRVCRPFGSQNDQVILLVRVFRPIKSQNDQAISRCSCARRIPAPKKIKNCTTNFLFVILLIKCDM